jgi:hypothetical protein
MPYAFAQPPKRTKNEKCFLSQSRRVRREVPKKNILQEMVFYSRELYSYPVNPVGSSESGREKRFCLSWRLRGTCLIEQQYSAGFAERDFYYFLSNPKAAIGLDPNREIIIHSAWN